MALEANDCIFLIPMVIFLSNLYYFSTLTRALYLSACLLLLENTLIEYAFFKNVLSEVG